MKKTLLPAEKIASLLQLEPAVALIGLATASWILYKFLLKQASPERHRNLRKLFSSLFGQVLVFTGILLAYRLLSLLPPTRLIAFLQPYLGLITLALGAVILIKTLRVMILEYLFLGHMRVGVPMLVVNIFSLLASLMVGAWMLTEIFGLKIGPLLATSAVFSIVLGLAMQDTLGNLFAGIALQIDKPYELGHWIEVQQGLQRWAGQVHEVSWRATVLIGLSDELMTIPNRIMAQSQISNFTMRGEPFARSQIFRVAHGSDLEAAKASLLKALRQVSEVLQRPEPHVYATEFQEQGILLKLSYYVSDYNHQFTAQDQVISLGTQALSASGITPAHQRHEFFHGTTI